VAVLISGQARFSVKLEKKVVDELMSNVKAQIKELRNS